MPSISPKKEGIEKGKGIKLELKHYIPPFV